MHGRYLLISDLDGTLLGDHAALVRFRQWLAQERSRFVLAYSSGRLSDSIAEAVDTYPLPEPDYVVAGVGTEIRFGLSGAAWNAWTARFHNWDADLVRRLLDGRARLRLQPTEFQTPHKVSYFAEGLTLQEREDIQHGLHEAGLRVQLIYSSNRDLDVLPAAAGKGEAAIFLARQLGIDTAQVIAAGDSGNDLCMLELAGRGIVVANALPELRALRLPTIYHSPWAYADGVLDGVQHWLRQLE